MKGSLLFLGTGGSMGIPVLTCDCSVCQSDDPKNKRLRPGAIVRMGGKTLLIDASQDIRQQLLTHKINDIDALLLTHTHHDHTAGIDDLRAFQCFTQKKLSCLLSEITYEDLRTRYHYIFEPTKPTESLVTQFDIQKLDGERGSAEICGQSVQYMTFFHAGMEVIGFRFGDLAYLSDIKSYPESIFEDLRGVKTLVVSALRYDPTPIHFNIDEALAFTDRVQAKSVWFTHIGHELDHEKTDKELPDHVQLAYDGLEIEFYQGMGLRS